MSAAPLEHFDEVELIETPTTLELEIAGERGVVLGITEEDGKRFYAIAVASLGRTVMLGNADVRPTGRRVERGDVYDGTTLRVDWHGRATTDQDENGE